MSSNQDCSSSSSITKERLENKTITQVFDLLSEVEDNFCSYPTLKNATLILGTTGVGKSTLVQRLVGHDDELEAAADLFGITIDSKRNKIGHSISEPKTLFPDLAINARTGAIYYDMPGFDDPRNIPYVIAITYFIKKIVDNIEQVKLVFLTGLNSLSTTEGRGNFQKLLENISKFVKNIEKFKDGTALVITKVPHVQGSPNNKTMAALVNIISNEAKGLPANNTRKFLDIILNSADGFYPKIIISETPATVGFLNNISYMVENTSNIIAKIDLLKFVDKTNSDFGYPVPKSSLKEVGDAIKNIQNKISASIQSCANELNTFLLNREETIYDIFKLKNETSTMHKKLEEMQRIANTQTEETNCFSKLKAGIALATKDDALCRQSLAVAAQHTNYLLFLKTVNEEKSEGLPECAKGLDEVIKNYHNSSMTYSFMADLYSEVSGHANCTTLTDNIKTALTNKSLPADISKSLFDCYPNHNNYGPGAFSTTMLNINRMVRFDKVLDLAQKNDLQVSCVSGHLRIKGHNIKFTDVLSKIEEHCDKAKPLKNVEIFALNKVFVNENFNLTNVDEGTIFSIIAPKWEISNNPKIILQGEDGEAIVPVKNPTVRGMGKPGLPGAPGGNFFGIGVFFENLQNLTISVIGGNGGPGQSGGNGADGVDGKNATNDVELCKCRSLSSLPCSECKSRKQHFVIFSMEESYYTGGSVTTYWYALSNQKITLEKKWMYLLVDEGLLLVHGAKGTDGFPGGDGGYGGIGGYGGNIIFPFLPPTSVAYKDLNSGTKGADGEGGAGGRGGMNGMGITVTIDYWRSIDSNGTFESPRLDDGEKGSSGYNKENQLQPKSKKALAELNLFEIVNDYKCYLRENLHNSVIESNLRDFLSKLESDPITESEWYNVMGFLDDLQKLENQFYKLHKSISFLPFYESFLGRVERFEKNNNSTYLKTLHYLRTVLSTKIFNIKNDYNYQLVDVENHTTAVKQLIQDHKNLSQNIKINYYRNNYKITINEQIIEAGKMINQTIIPSIDEIYLQIDEQIRLLIADVNKQVGDNERDKSELLKKRNQLLTQLPLRTTVGVLKTASMVLAVIGPFGALASGVAGVAIQGVESAVFNEDYTKIITSSQKPITHLKDFYKNEQSLLKINFEGAKLLETQKAFNHTAVNFKKVSDSISTLKKLIDDGSLVNFYEGKLRLKEDLEEIRVDLLKKRDELKKEVDPGSIKVSSEAKKQNLERDKIQNDEAYEKKGRIVIQMQAVLGAAEAGVQLFNQLNEKNKDIIGTDAKIQDVLTEITKLKSYENLIKNGVVDETKAVERQLQNLSNLSAHSHISLDSTKWKLENLLLDFKVKMEYLIQQSSDPFIKGKFLACIDKLQGGVSTVIQIYHHIQNYKEQEKLIDYIGDINLTGTSETDDLKLNLEIDKLKFLLTSNLILLEYGKLSSAFNQYAFPFANELHQREFNVTSFFESKNITQEVVEVIHQIENMRNFFSNEDSKTDNTKTKFSNIKFHEKSAFFVWKYHTYKKEISALLKGEWVTLKANIIEGYPANAVKFKEIGIKFLLANETMQNNFNQELKDINVVMIHMGDSYYKCDNKFYVFDHNILNTTHSILADDNKSYGHFDDNYKILKNNVPIFSPYATWKIKLYNVYPKTDIKNIESFLKAKKFENQAIDLALEGVGGYVQLHSDTCSQNLEKYYKLDETLSSKPTLPNEKPVNIRKKRHVEVDYESLDKSVDTSLAINVTSPSRMLNFSSNTSKLSAHRAIKDYTSSEKDNPQPFINSTNFNIFETITLVDFFAKWFTKAKPQHYYSSRETDLVEVRASALNIMSLFENLINKVSKRFKLPAESLEFDYIALMSTLERELINGADRSEIIKLLHRTIVQKNNDAHFHRIVWDEIDEMLHLS